MNLVVSCFRTLWRLSTTQYGFFLASLVQCYHSKRIAVSWLESVYLCVCVCRTMSSSNDIRCSLPIGSPFFFRIDLTKWLDQKAKSDVSEFTAKEKYKFGDISKEIIKRFQNGEYTKDDIILFLKIVAMIGIELQPIASFLPIKVLIQMLDVSIAQDVSGKVLGVISKEVDSRMKQFVTGDADYKVGDITKKAITGSKGESGYQFGDLTKHAISKFTGKSNYEFGDITRKLTSGSSSGGNSSKESSSNTTNDSNASNNEYNNDMIIDILNDDKIRNDLDEWDKKYLLAQQQQQQERKEDEREERKS